MNKKIFENARFCPKGDTEANWKKAVGFIPLDKEIIIYKADETHSAARFKVGDGKTGINDLPFSGTDMEAIQQLINEKGELLVEYVDNAVAAIDFPDVDQVYNSESENAQSGFAVAEAIFPIIEKNNEQDDKIAELEDRITYITLENIGFISNKCSFDGMEGMTKIDWGDGTINNELSHEYADNKDYNCKIYDVVKLGKINARIKNIRIGRSVTTIGEHTFNGQVILESIVIPDNVMSIGSSAFSGCNNLKSVVIGDGVTSIGSSAFDGCSDLKNIVIPSSVVNIGTGAFHLGLIFLSIVFKNYNPINYNSMFGPLNEYFKIKTYVPYGCAESYKTKWAADGAEQDILDAIVESDREAMMSDLNSGLDTKLDKSGGLIGGDLSIQGNLNVAGTTTTQDTETLMVKDNTIVANSDGNILIENAGFAVRTSTTDAYGIMYDPVGDGVKIGLGSFDENGKFKYTEGEDQFLATRADTIVDGHIPKWDDEAKEFVDSGVGSDEYVKFTDIATNNKSGVGMVLQSQGIYINSGYFCIQPATNDDIDKATSIRMPITTGNYKYAVKKGITTNTETLSEDSVDDSGNAVEGEKTKACKWIGAVRDNQYATADKAGIGKISKYYGVYLQDGFFAVNSASNWAIDNRNDKATIGSDAYFVPLTRLDYSVLKAITTNSLTPTDEQKVKACDFVGAVKKPNAPSAQSVLTENNKGEIELIAIAPGEGNRGIYGNIPRYNNPIYDKADSDPATNMGMLTTNYPTKKLHCANKGWVEGYAVAKNTTASNGLYGRSAGNEILYSVSQWGAGGGEDAIARRTSKGGLRVFLDETNANPEQMATPRGYVDNLPDKLILTDDTTDDEGNLVTGTKTKWINWLGASTATNWRNGTGAGSVQCNETRTFAEGQNSIAWHSHCLGKHSFAGGNSGGIWSGSNSFLWGTNCGSYGDFAITFGNTAFAESTAKQFTFLHGDHVRTAESISVAFGAYNAYADETNYLFMLGNGTSDTERSNALIVYKDGSAKFSGTVEVAEPTADGHATNKGWVENYTVAKSTTKDIVYGVDSNGNQKEYPCFATERDPYTIGMRDSTGNFRIADTPTQSYHTASKGYVDEKIAELQAQIDALKGQS